jgi:hypothetical protein
MGISELLRRNILVIALLAALSGSFDPRLPRTAITARHRPGAGGLGGPLYLIAEFRRDAT